jgi:NADP-dependent 3-hydroxy acid dehydrogenase YdfG
MPTLANKVTLITGAAGSIGTAVARRFVADGARVALAEIREEDVARLAHELQGLALTLDVRSDESWAAATAATIDRFGRMDILINNAGVADPANLEEVSLEKWDQHVAVNQTGVILGMRHAAPHMRAPAAGRSSTSPRFTASSAVLLEAAARWPTRRPRAPCGS